MMISLDKAQLGCIQSHNALFPFIRFLFYFNYHCISRWCSILRVVYTGLLVAHCSVLTVRGEPSLAVAGIRAVSFQVPRLMFALHFTGCFTSQHPKLLLSFFMASFCISVLVKFALSENFNLPLHLFFHISYEYKEGHRPRHRTLPGLWW